MNFESAVNFLKSFRPYEDQGFPVYNEDNFNLKGLNSFLKAYGVDYKTLKCVHVAGSKGKSTTCFMVGNYLWKKGLKTGIFTSPYMIDMTECIWINGRNISKKDFVRYVEELKDLLVKCKGVVPTYFELLVAISLKIFIENNVDFAVIEVGLGGRLDATNVIEAEVAVLTTVEKEHTEVLGKTYDKILNEKLGIVIGKKVKKLVVGWQSPYVRDLIKKKIANTKKVVFVEEKDNKAVAREVLKMLNGRVDEKVLDGIVCGLKIIGRFDVRLVGRKTIVFDMAHTKNSVKVLIERLENQFPNKNFLFLVSIMKNKRVEDILRLVCALGKKDVAVTSSNFERGYSALELKDLAGKMGLKVEAIENYEKAYEKMIKKMRDDNILVVTGSHFLVGKVLSGLFRS